MLGGGPAGVAAALTLHQRGLTVVVLERTRYANTRFGETLPPAIQVPLARIGLWDTFLGQAPRPAHAIRSYWGAAEPVERSFLFSPHGSGWHIDRPLFDSGLAEAARSRGIVVATQARSAVERDPTGSGWLIDVVINGHHHQAETRWLVVANGRRRLPTGIAVEGRQVLDRLVAVAGYLESPDPGAQGPQIEPLTIIEAAEEGWWYSAPLPSGHTIAALFTDADICRQQQLSNPLNWTARLACTSDARRRAHNHKIKGGLRTVKASSARLCRPYGPGWIAVGDSALSCDPLAGNGIGQAIDGGYRGAEALSKAADGDRQSFFRYAEEQAQRWDAFIDGRAAYYRIESRWPDRPFWQRRRT